MSITEAGIIKQAILNEVEGYEFYRMASVQANSKEVREAFMELAAEELEHINWLKAFYNKLIDGKAQEFDLGLLTGNTSSPKIFNWGNLDRKDAAIALSVFGIGLQMERNAASFYDNASRDTTVLEARELYKKLSAWEQTHLEQFSKEYDRLAEEWWMEQGFSPF